MKKEKILLIIGVILALGVGFLARGVLLSPIIDEVQIRAEIEQEIKEQVNRETDIKALERLGAVSLIIKAEGRADQKTWVMGKVFEIDENKREIKVKIMNSLFYYREESFTEFLKQPHYFEKRVIILPDTIFFAFREPDFTFQDLKTEMRLGIRTTESFIIGREEIIAEKISIFPDLIE